MAEGIAVFAAKGVGFGLIVTKARKSGVEGLQLESSGLDAFRFDN